MSSCIMKKYSWKSSSFSPIFLALLILLNTAPGFAEDQPEATENVAQQTEETQAIDPTPLEDPAWQLYHQAFVEALRENNQTAEKLLNQLIQEYPQHGATPLAHRILAVISLVAENPPAPTQPTEQPAATPRPTTAYVEPEEPLGRKLNNGERTSQQARAELVIFQTLHGIAAGLETCIALDCGSPAATFGSLTAGAGLGLAGSLFLSRDGVSPGQSGSYNSGAVWGFWNGLTLALALDLDNGRALAGTMLAGQAIGLGGGALAWHLFEPTSATVSLASSGAIWTTAITALIHGVAGSDVSDGIFWGSLMGASSAGLVAGALLANEFPMSRGRALVIDSGGLLGALVGFSAYLVFSDDRADNVQAAMASGLAGTVAGLAAATYFSRNWDIDDATSAQLFITPTDGGALVGLGGQF